MYIDANNLYGCAISQIIPLDGFKWKKILPHLIKTFIQNYNGDSGKGYIL